YALRRRGLSVLSVPWGIHAQKMKTRVQHCPSLYGIRPSGHRKIPMGSTWAITWGTMPVLFQCFTAGASRTVPLRERWWHLAGSYAPCWGPCVLLTAGPDDQSKAAGG